MKKVKSRIPKKFREKFKRFQLRKSKMFAGIFLMVQSTVLFLLFVASWSKSKSLAKALAAIAAVESISGALLVLSELYDKRMIREMDRQFEEFDEEDDEEYDEEFANEE